MKQENSTYPEFYVYDPNGRLNIIARPVNLGLSDGSTITVMYPIIQYVWGADRVLAKIDTLTDESYYYLYNGHGDVVQIVDTAGNIVNQYDYDVWGNFLTKQETIDNHFTYFGQTYDKTTGLYYLRARYYDPATGRFTQQDPAEDGYNWYVYGNQNPVMFVDYNGTDGKAVDLGKGWYYRIDAADSSTGTQRHIHITNGKKSYSQNEDGSPHDKNNNSKGEPPKKILKKVKEKANWDYKAKDNAFFENVDIVNMDSVAIITYPNGYQLVKGFKWYEPGYVTKAQARTLYYNASFNNGTSGGKVFVTPIITNVTIPTISPMFVPAFGF